MRHTRLDLTIIGLKRRIIAPVVTLLTACLALALAAAPAYAATWGSSDRWASWSNGGYTLYNDVWGNGAGPQSIWANSYSNWGVWSDQPNTGGIKSYPNVTRWVGTPINSLNSVTSGYNVSVPSAGAYETAYDIWDSSNSNEIMLWLNQTGPIGPIGSYVTTVWLGGYNWNVYKGWNGANNVYSFLNTGRSTSGTVNILDVLRWLENSAHWIGNVTLGNVQFGWEITSSSGGMNFQTNSYWVSYN
ncbi:GH12 family glycosyl hydrolase domain-containing protein [Kutzneria kofuensis]|uniref:Glycosyl hydrolase family 12 n=1 Tax=Kutzneria kofuensis TaxID=103725 RepID=A0A7W9KPQ0_9PSEU|nr:hypothetical protein [Kutzneria kofuensis]MBB5896447.1 hypothetical protein [Kutzneria kofuensis]